MWQQIKNYYHLVQAVIANTYYGFPSQKLKVIGVTGTDGKTTTTSIIYHILKLSGIKAAMITSVGAYIGDSVYDIGFHVTTPSPFGLQKYIKKAVDAGVEYLVLETTSHAIDQNRVWGIDYEIGVLTNITHEHLDYHKTWEEYADVKIGFVVGCQWSVVNMDDESYALVISKVKNQISKPYVKSQILIEDQKSLIARNNILTTYSLQNSEADITPKKFPFTTKLLGEFNISNCLAAIAACKQVGITDAYIKKAVSTFTPPPGRQEIVYDKEFRVMIDFAHTPNAFVQILPEVKKMTKGRLIHVFGSAGRRDFTKRPEMGEAAGKFDDVIILTSEDPRDEKVENINASIKSGINKEFDEMPDIKSQNSKLKITSQKSKVDKILYEIPNRREAIHFAVSIAQKGDTVLLTGKGHEKSMNMGSGEEPWDEYAVVKEAFKISIINK